MKNILTERQLKIMRCLFTHNVYVSLESISNQTAISKRTLRRDIKDINDKLSADGIRIVSKRGSGVKTKFSDANAEIASGKIFINEIDSFNNNVRLLKIASELLMNSPRSTSISELAKKYFISRASIVNDLKKIELWLSDFSLTLTKDLSGTRIEGSDQDIRVAMKALVLKSIYRQQNLMESRIDDSIILELSERFGEQHVLFTVGLISYIEKQLTYSIGDPYYINFFTHVLVLIHRINTREQTYLDANPDFSAMESRIYQISRAAVERIEYYYQVKLGTVELQYIYQYLVSSGKTGIDSLVKMQSNDSQRASAFTKMLIDKVSARIKVDITMDTHLLESLLSHVKPMLNRLEYRIRIKNPLLHDIKNELGSIFLAVKSSMAVMTHEYGFGEINDDEIGYLTVHIQAAIESNIKKNRVLLVCSSGLGTSQLLYGRVIRAFPDWEIVDIVPGKEIAEYIKRQDVDIIISTVKLEPVEKPVVYVSALFSAKDITRVTECLVSNYMK
ncbi:PRD domain-containing protein [Brenneria sp. g21c3]|uniref:BglG family transcription antiterminator n=1 Tax=Brenneria sp. g21c3 TaxID=3093893 RepID=UPI002EA4194F|nr:PRD domain-containing protein [Brenneria sp. g21c3]